MNWYEAISEDLDINLIKLRDAAETGISQRSLRGYRKRGNVPSKKDSIDSIFALVKAEKPDFTRDTLLKYFADYQEVSNDLVKQSYILKIQKALQGAEDEGIKLEASMLDLPKQVDELANWVYKTMFQPEGIDEVEYLLKATRRQVTSRKQLYKVWELHDAIAPLIIKTVDCVKPAQEEVCSLSDVDDPLSAPAIANLSILRSQGEMRSLKISTKGNHFTVPENAVIEESYSAEDGNMKDRLSIRILQTVNLLPDSALVDKHKLTDYNKKSVIYHGKRNQKDIDKPYLYFANNEDYPKDQLQDIADYFKGYHVFADTADNKLNVFSDEFALHWLHKMYADLNVIEQGQNDMVDIRATIDSLVSSGGNEYLQVLHQSGRQIEDKDYLDKLEKLTTIGANMPKVVEGGMSLYEKASAFLTALSLIISAAGGS